MKFQEYMKNRNICEEEDQEISGDVLELLSKISNTLWTNYRDDYMKFAKSLGNDELVSLCDELSAKDSNASSMDAGFGNGEKLVRQAQNDMPDNSWD